MKLRGIVTSGGEGEGHTGWGLNPEGGASILFFDIRWVGKAVAGGETQQGNSFFAGVSLGLP